MIDCNQIPNLAGNFNLLANYSTHGGLTIDMQRTILMANERACKLLGYASLVGMNLRDIAPPLQADFPSPECLEKGYGSDLRQFLREDGRLVWMNAQGIVLRDELGTPWGFYIYIYDCTTERKLRAEVEHLSDKLRDIVATIQQELTTNNTMPPDITVSEKAIAKLVKGGFSSKEIADIRGMGVKSVENVRVSLRKKLAVDRGTSLQAALQEYGDV